MFPVGSPPALPSPQIWSETAALQWFPTNKAVEFQTAGLCICSRLVGMACVCTETFWCWSRLSRVTTGTQWTLHFTPLHFKSLFYQLPGFLSQGDRRVCCYPGFSRRSHPAVTSQLHTRTRSEGQERNLLSLILNVSGFIQMSQADLLCLPGNWWDQLMVPWGH